MFPLLCPSCGGPQPQPLAGASHLTCAFCGTSAVIEVPGRTPQVSPRAQASAVAIQQRFAAELRALEGGFGEAVRAGKPPREALHAAATAALGSLCDPTTLTNVVLGLAQEFERSRKLRLDPGTALPRIATSYLGALEHLRAHGRHELKIPFIAASASGPVDFQLVVTIEQLQALARGTAKPENKGLFRRIFG